MPFVEAVVITVFEKFTLGSTARTNWPRSCLTRLGVSCRVNCFCVSITHLRVGRLLDHKLGLSKSDRWLAWLREASRGPALSYVGSGMREGKEEATPRGPEAGTLAAHAPGVWKGAGSWEQNSSGKSRSEVSRSTSCIFWYSFMYFSFDFL